MIVLAIVRIRSSAWPLVKEARVQISLDETTWKRVDNSIICEIRSQIGTSLTVSSSPLFEVTRNGRQTLAYMLASVIGNHVVQEAMKLDEGYWRSTGTAGVIDQSGIAIFVGNIFSRVKGPRDRRKCRNSR
jgi:hypothetical protein